MIYNKEKWIAAIKKAVADLKTEKATQGRVCALATCRFIRDGLVDDIIGDKKKPTEEEAAWIDTIKSSMNELIAIVSKDCEHGFASNASAAAKAAGFKSEAETMAGLAE